MARRLQRDWQYCQPIFFFGFLSNQCERRLRFSFRQQYLRKGKSGPYKSWLDLHEFSIGGFGICISASAVLGCAQTPNRNCEQWVTNQREAQLALRVVPASERVRKLSCEHQR